MTYRGGMPGGPLLRHRFAGLLTARPVTATLTAALALLILGTGLTGGTPALALAQESYPPALSAFYTQQPSWTPCESAAGSGQHPTRELCTWITVPLDYAAPAGPTIRLRVTKWPATGSTRVGSLLVNPGGPGASGLDFASYLASSAPAIAAAYDVVGFDPRGVGQSAPITCLTGSQTTALLRLDSTPTTAPQENAYVTASAAVGEGCLTLSPSLARNVGTDNTVQDMDILRAVLGDDKLNWFGASYGTYLGTRYIQQFPTRVGRMVLDGVVDPGLDAMGLSYGQSLAFQRAVERFAADCARLRSCPYRGGTSAVVGSINTLLARLDNHPMATMGSRRLVQAEALNALIYAMYTPFLWPDLRSALAAATLGNGTPLQRMAAAANDQTGPDTYASNGASAFPAIGCWDQPAPPGPDGLRAASRTWAAHAKVPEIARALAWGNASCALWFGHSPVLPGPVTSTTTAQVLLVGTTYDPATPYWWAQDVHKQMPTSTLLTYYGDGHTAFGNGSTCIDRAVTSYLVRGVMPAPDTVCR